MLGLCRHELTAPYCDVNVNCPPCELTFSPQLLVPLGKAAEPSRWRSLMEEVGFWGCALSFSGGAPLPVHTPDRGYNGII